MGTTLCHWLGVTRKLCVNHLTSPLIRRSLFCRVFRKKFSVILIRSSNRQQNLIDTETTGGNYIERFLTVIDILIIYFFYVRKGSPL